MMKNMGEVKEAIHARCKIGILGQLSFILF